MSKPKIGRVILSTVIALVAVKLAGGSKPVEYSPSCNAEYLDVEVINHNRVNIPKTLETKEGCTLNVSFNTEARSMYFSLDNSARSKFRIRGRRDGEFVSVFNVYFNDTDNLRTKEITLNKQLLKNTGKNSKCFISPEDSNQYCFQKEPYLNNYNNYQLALTVDTSNTIIEVNQIK